MRFHSTCFLLIADKKSVLQRRSGSNDNVEELHAIAIQMDSFHDIAADGNSSVNRQEAEAVTNMIVALLRLASLQTTTSVDRITAKDIGVISCYAGQITLIERLLKEHTCISAEDRKVNECSSNLNLNTVTITIHSTSRYTLSNPGAKANTLRRKNCFF